MGQFLGVPQATAADQRHGYLGFLDNVINVVETQFADWTKPNYTLGVHAQLLKTLCL
jgi:hypothetical protein